MGNSCSFCDSISEPIPSFQFQPVYQTSNWPSNDPIIREWLHRQIIPQIKEKKPLKLRQKQVYVLNYLSSDAPANLGIIYEKGVKFYEGQIKNNVANGKGKVTFLKQRWLYKGEMKDGQADGHGQYMNEDKSIIFNGVWRNSLPFSGKITFKNHKNVSVIEFFDFQSDEQTFEGKIFYNDEKTYEGNIDKALFIPHGQGKVVFQNSQNDEISYTGDWVYGEKHGEGEFIWKNSSYLGTYFNNKKQGFGKYTYKNQSFYEGYWLAGKQEGLGVIYSQMGIQHQRGRWENGRFVEELTFAEWEEQDSKLKKDFTEKKIRSYKLIKEKQKGRKKEKEGFWKDIGNDACQAKKQID